MDDDGLQDIVTVRSSFRVRGGFCPPSGQLVWFRNPGDDLQPDVEWQEFVVVDTEPKPGGPEVNMNVADLDGDGVPEIIATHFFKYDGITIYGAPEGGRWSDVDPVNGPFVRQNDIMRGQGNPFAVQVDDLNLDGRLDVLTSNHQPDDCFEVTQCEVPGRVIVLEQPAAATCSSASGSCTCLRTTFARTRRFRHRRWVPGGWRRTARWRSGRRVSCRA